MLPLDPTNFLDNTPPPFNSPPLYSLGPILLGTIFNVLFYGIMVMQSFIYFQRFKQYVY